MEFKRISVTQAQAMIGQASAAPLQIIDIRDDAAYAAGHLDSAVHIHGSNVQEFIEGADPEAPLLVYCYHGNMSQSAAAYFAAQGFAETYSLDGGYEAWKASEEENLKD